MSNRRSSSFAVLACIAAATVVGAGTASAHPARAAAPAAGGSFVGIVSEDSFAQAGAYRLRQFKDQVKSGIGVVRQTFAWSSIETAPGRYRLARYDRYVGDAARSGLTVLPILFDPPAFRERPRAPGASGTTTAPPRDMAAMARWATVLVRRYGSNGSLWRQHPELPKRPIRDWQVWNEPNLPAYWNARPNAAQYVEMLTVVGEAIRRADSSSRIVSAGLPESRLGISFSTFLRQMYAAGAQDRFDVLAINAYSKTAGGLETAIAGARRITAAAEDGDVPIALTEFGWATPPGPRGSFTVSERRQGNLIAQAISKLARERSRLGIEWVIYYQWRDAPVYAGGRDFWGLHTGLLRKAGTAKPALRSFARAALPTRAR
jgi:hypothetical protein